MNGSLGKAMSQAGAFVKPYTVPANADFATVSINICNKGATDAKVRLALSTVNPPNPEDYVEHDAVVPANGGSLERTCITASAGEQILIFSDSPNLAIRVYGLEEITTY